LLLLLLLSLLFWFSIPEGNLLLQLHFLNCHSERSEEAHFPPIAAPSPTAKA